MSIDLLILAGGPDPEREISLLSAEGVRAAVAESSDIRPRVEVIDRLSGAELADMAADIIWPALHGRWGEGGPCQVILESDGRPYVGSGPLAARIAIDKFATRHFAAASGLNCPAAALLDPQDDQCPLPLPVVVKPVFGGSTIGLFVCHTAQAWSEAWRAAADAGEAYMVEQMITGRELTVGLIEREGRLDALPVVEIAAAGDLYDYEAKYFREDTRYVVHESTPAPGMSESALRVADAIGVRHVARADFILDESGRTWFLELNTMPGFTSHSLTPMAAAHAGIDMTGLCTLLVHVAMESATLT